MQIYCLVFRRLRLRAALTISLRVGHHRMGHRGVGHLWAAPLCIALLGAALLPSRTSADQIVLRDTTILTDVRVAEVDLDGIRLDSGTRYGWDRVKSGRVAGALQPEFDRLLNEVGPQLYRIRQRLRVGDYRDLLPAVEAVYSDYRTRRSPTSYMVLQAAMWAYLAEGKREHALEPYLRCIDLIRREVANPGDLPGRRKLQFDPRTGFAAELDPIWFDEDAASRQLEFVKQAIQSMLLPRPDGVYIYYATLAIRAGQFDDVERVLQAVSSSVGVVPELKLVVLAQLEVRRGRPAANLDKLRREVAAFQKQSQPLGYYWLGTAALKSRSAETRRSGLLDLLRVPALYGSEHAELSAAALYQVSRQLEEMEDATGSVAVRNELLDAFGQTFFARQTRAEPD